KWTRSLDSPFCQAHQGCNVTRLPEKEFVSLRKRLPSLWTNSYLVWNRGRCTARSHEAVRGESKECLTNTSPPRLLVPSVTAAVARSHCSLTRRCESQARAAKVVLFWRC